MISYMYTMAMVSIACVLMVGVFYERGELRSMPQKVGDKVKEVVREMDDQGYFEPIIIRPAAPEKQNTLLNHVGREMFHMINGRYPTYRIRDKGE